MLRTLSCIGFARARLHGVVVAGSLGLLGVACSEGSGANPDDMMNEGGDTGEPANMAGMPASMGGAGGAPAAVTATTLYSFDTDPQGFALVVAAGTAPFVNLGDPTAEPPSPAMASADWTATDVDPNAATPGCLEVSADFSFWNQSVSVEVSGPGMAQLVDAEGQSLDLTDMTVSARVRLEGGLSPFGVPPTVADAPGGIIFYIKSTSAAGQFIWGQNFWMNMTQYGVWTTVTFDTSAPFVDPANPIVGWDPAFPFQMGFQLSSGGGGTHCTLAVTGTPLPPDPDTCPEWEEPLPTTLCIDNITVRPNP